MAFCTAGESGKVKRGGRGGYWIREMWKRLCQSSYEWGRGFLRHFSDTDRHLSHQHINRNTLEIHTFSNGTLSFFLSSDGKRDA